jgi:biopolymer transport protein ExbB/TolQ
MIGLLAGVGLVLGGDDRQVAGSFGRMRRAFDRFEDTFWSGQSLEELYRSLAEKQAGRDGRAVRGGDARMEEELRARRAFAGQPAERASTGQWTWRWRARW